MTVPEAVVRLVEEFRANESRYTHPLYKEYSVRSEFINPLFEELGWPVTTTHGVAPEARDVVFEDTIRAEDAGGDAIERIVGKVPDYSFRIDGKRKFYVEAKKPYEELETNRAHAFQVRAYGWSARLPISILTDFQQFSVYDCRIKPDRNDLAKVALLPGFYFTYDQYAERWDEIAALLHRDAVAAGSLDKLMEKRLAGALTVDAAFLKEISEWREMLAREIATRNPLLSQRDLNYAVQMTINRIIFLRIAEDRGIEPEEQLKLTLKYGGGMYGRLVDLFTRAHERYNSGLFHFKPEKGIAEQPDEFTLNLQIGDEPIARIVEHLYYPSPYKFDVIPIEILGQVYEQFLGKVIRFADDGSQTTDNGDLTQNSKLKTQNPQVVIEDKPEVRKAGGVYYTPTYIVDYIVEQTVGKLLEGKTPKEAMSLRILDPACGSGSFLIGAYSYLLDWHLRWYTENKPESHARGKNAALVRIASGGEGAPAWRLSIGERKRILRNNIYGVDIDTQAVEVTKLSLLLKVLEGETRETLGVQLGLAGVATVERVLPDLGENIKSGNSLIGPDFYSTTQASFLDMEEQHRINAFDWQSEFKEIMKVGGFDAVIGNPPYIRIQTLKEWAPLEVEHYKRRYISARKGNYDIYVVFVEKGLDLLNSRGQLGFILPHKFFNAQYGEPLRGLLSQGNFVSQVVHFGDEQVFVGATTYTTLLFLTKEANKDLHVVKVEDLDEWRRTRQAPEGLVSASSITRSEWNFAVGGGRGLFERLSQLPVKLDDIAAMFVGLQTSADTVFLFKDSKIGDGAITKLYSKALGDFINIESDILKPVIRSGNIGRYAAQLTALVLFPYSHRNGRFHLLSEQEMQNNFPLAWDYLCANKELLSGREHGKFAQTGWYQLYPKNLDVWEQRKLMLPYMITRLAAFYDEGKNYFVNVTTGGFGVTVDERHGSLKYISGLLNSQLLDWFLKNVTTNFRSGYFAANKQFLVQLPIRTINFSDPTDKARHDQMVSLVERMLRLHKDLAEAKSPYDKGMLERQIKVTDEAIDRLVYELYGLTEEEIRVVEGA